MKLKQTDKTQYFGWWCLLNKDKDIIYINDNSLIVKIEKEREAMKKLNITYNRKYNSVAEAFAYEGAYNIYEFINCHDENRPRNMKELDELMHEASEIKQCLKVLAEFDFYDVEGIDWNREFEGYNEYGDVVWIKRLSKDATYSLRVARMCIKHLDTVMNDIVADYFLKVIERELSSTY